MKNTVSRIVLPQFELTQTCNSNDPNAVRIELRDGTHYSVRPQLLPHESTRPGGKPSWLPRKYRLYPLVLTSDGTPWDEVNVWILSSLEGKLSFNMSTSQGKASDLQHFRNYLDSRGIDWCDFPENKLLRPTYRYRGFLRLELEAGNLGWSTAKRRISNVVQFYRWLIDSKVWSPAHAPWIEKEITIPALDRIGRTTNIRAKTTDVNIRNAKAEDPFDDCINDGGKLRPLSAKEQAWILEALSQLRNTEQTLIHALALSTGARIQTVLTIRTHHVLGDAPNGPVRLLCGPGTGIDTKGDVKQTIEIPRWLYIALQTYALSERAARRRRRAAGGEVDEQYLFLSERGAPMYEAKVPPHAGGEHTLRHEKNGQAVRAYMTDYIIPWVRRAYSPDFSYRFHDLRASFGMNLVDELCPQLDAGQLTYLRILQIVQARMNHRTLAVTERYLRYRSNRKLFDMAQHCWEEKIQGAIERMMGVS